MKRLLMVFVFVIMLCSQAWGAYEKSGLIYYPTDGTSAAALLVGIEAKGTPCTMKFVHTSGVSTPYEFPSGVTFPEYVTLDFEQGAILVVDVGGGSYITIKGNIKAGPLQQIFEEVSGEVLFTSTTGITTVWPHWWGIDGASDQVQLNRAINAANNSKTACLIPWLDYYVDDSVYIPAGSNYVAMASQNRGEYASTGKGLITWTGGVPTSGTSDAILKIGRQLDSFIGGLSVYGGSDTDGEGIIGMLFYDDDINTGTGSVYGYNKFEHLKSKKCDIGFLLGNYNTATVNTDSSGYWQGGDTNFNHCTWSNLHTFDVANPLIYDALQSDNSKIDMFVNGGTDARFNGAHVIHIKRVGNELTLNRLMLAGNTIQDENAFIKIDDGDGTISTVNLESGTSNRFLDITHTTGRGEWIISDVRASTVRDSNGTFMDLAYRGGMILIGIDSPGNILYSGPLASQSAVFRLGYGFVKNGSAGFLQDIGTWTRLSDDVGALISGNPDGNLTIGTLDTDELTNNIVPTFNKKTTTALLVDETPTNIFEAYFVSGEARTIGLKGFYNVGKHASSTTLFSQVGEFTAIIMKDTGDNFTTDIDSGLSSQALDGYTSVNVSFDIDTSSGTTAYIRCTQNNEALDTNAYGYFSIESLSSKGANSNVLRDQFDWSF